MRSVEADNGPRDAHGSDGDRASRHQKHVERRRVIIECIWSLATIRTACFAICSLLNVNANE